MQARHSEFEKHHQQLQLEEEEAAQRAAEFKVSTYHSETF
jgi:hypothetical protein